MCTCLKAYAYNVYKDNCTVQIGLECATTSNNTRIQAAAVAEKLASEL